MTELTTSWKVFRVISIIQLVLVALQLLLSVLNLFYGSIWFPLLGILVYAAVFYFVYNGLSVINYNFPDTPLSPKQKQIFNRLFIINFLLIAYLFAQVVNSWWIIPFVIEADKMRLLTLLGVLLPFISAALIFILHLVFMGGMIQLRRTIHQNTVTNWYQQFDDPQPDNNK